MFSLTIRGLATRKVRTVLTAFAVFLGVALISGTYILTDTISRSFDGIFATASKGVDVSLSPREVISQRGSRPTFPESVLAEAKTVPGVKQAAGSIFAIAVILKKDGTRLSLRAPTFITGARPAPFNPFRYTIGRPPRTDNEVALDVLGASKGGYKVGDKVGIVGAGPKQSYTLVGIAQFGAVDSLAGASVAIMALPQAQRALAEVGRLGGVDIEVADSATPESVVLALKKVMPATVTVRTGKQQAAAQAQDTKSALSFLTTILLVFAGIALFVGGFMIFNTFSITTAQRTREFALLRTLGASRRQILISVVGEALLIGLLASALGLLAGVGIAPALKALFKAFGADLPAQGTVLLPRTVVVAMVLGTVLTVVASLSPALRATRVAPLAALHEGAVLPRGRLAALRLPLAVAITVLGVALLVLGLAGSGALELVGAGAATIFIGVAMSSPYVVKPLASVIGAVMERLRGVTGRIARENATRNPSRTASTAAALMIGLALVTFVSIFAAGAKASISDAINKGFVGAFVVQSTDGRSTIAPQAAKAIASVEGVSSVAESRETKAKVAGVGTVGVSGVTTETVTSLFKFDWAKGSNSTLTTLRPTEAVVAKKFAEENHLSLGDKMAVTTADGHHLGLTVRGIYGNDTQLLNDVTVSLATITDAFGVTQDQAAYVGIDATASPAAVQSEIKKLLEVNFPTTKALTKQEFSDNIASQINQLLGFFYVLLSLSVVVSLFGIVNTLALSIHERTRELGLLRAIGMSRRQVRTIVRYEAVITALIGAVLGLCLGIFFAAVMAQALKDDGFRFALPVPTLLVLLVLAGLAGVLAAIFPARRAARLNVLDALSHE